MIKINFGSSIDIKLGEAVENATDFPYGKEPANSFTANTIIRVIKLEVNPW